MEDQSLTIRLKCRKCGGWLSYGSESLYGVIVMIPHECSCESNIQYGVHVTGSDDIHGPFENEYMALKEANAINKISVKENMDRDDVIFLVATVHIWKSLTNKDC